jgi:hypothetical protein
MKTQRTQMEKTLRVLLLVLSLPMLVLGLVSMFSAGSVLEKWGVTPVDANGLSTIRSIVGGLLIGSALQIIIGVWKRNSTWLMASAVLMAVIIFGRVVGVVFDGFHSAIIGPTLFEFVAMVLAVFYYKKFGSL